MTTTSRSVSDELAAAFDAAGVDAAFHAVDLQSGAEVSHRPDEQSVAASVFKLPVLVALVRAADAGLVTLHEQMTVPVEGRAPGPTGLSTMSDPVTKPGPYIPTTCHEMTSAACA